MAKKKNNYKMLGGIAAIVVFGLMFFSFSFNRSNITRTNTNNNNSSTTSDAKIVKSLTANYKSMLQSNIRLSTEIANLKRRVNNSASGGSTETVDKLNQLTNQNITLDNQIAGLREQLNSIDKKSSSSSDTRASSYSTNGANSVETDDQNKKAINNHNVQGKLIVSAPDLSLSKTKENPNTNNRYINHNPLAKNPNIVSSNDLSQKSKPIPYYRISAGVTISEVKLMSSIIAEVPVDGTLVQAPYPFKAIVQPKNILASRGVKLPPQLGGIVVEGYTFGNAQLGCARGYITGMLFSWSDGTYSYTGQSMTNSKSYDYNQKVLGYISSPNGDVCIHGKVISNVAPVITNLSLMGGVAQGGKALSQSSNASLLSGGSTVEVTKNLGQSLAGSMLSGSATQADDWYKKRIGDIFDVVYIPAAINHKVAHITINITKDITISKDNKKKYVLDHQGENSNDLAID